MVVPTFSRFLQVLAVIALAFSGLTWSTNKACAAGPAVPPWPAYNVCDIKFMDSLKEKGRAEALREIESNNSIITKPSSVLALSCFDQFIKEVSSVDSVFSGSATALDGSINTAIGGAFDSFISDNFADDLSPSVGSGTTFSSGGGYGACDRIKDLWTQVKCSSMPAAQFSTLEEFRATQAAGTDLRATGDYDCPADDSIYEAGVKSSLDLENTRSDRNAGAPAGYEYFNIARPDWCSTDPKEGPGPLSNTKICTKAAVDQFCSNMPAVPTGMVVSYTEPIGGVAAGTFMWSYQCLNPGCYFDVAANAGAIKYVAGAVPPTGLHCAEKPY